MFGEYYFLKGVMSGKRAFLGWDIPDTQRSFEYRRELAKIRVRRQKNPLRCLLSN